MKRKIRKGMRLVLLAVFLVSTTALLGRICGNVLGNQSYEKALTIASGSNSTKQTETTAETLDWNQTESEPVTMKTIWISAPIEGEDPQLAQMKDIDLNALRVVNQDVLGWIRIPDSKIDYPVLQGADNDYYLDHTWDRRKHAVGSVFMEYQNNADLTDYHTILYGHNMNDGSMFAGLRRYSSAKYWETHPYVYLTDGTNVYRYEIFAAYRAKVKSTSYELYFSEMQDKNDFLTYIQACSVIETGIVPEETDRILTMSTCAGAGYATRWVVHARLKMVPKEVPDI